MTTYKKLNDVITIKQSNSALNDVPLSYNGTPLYFGLEDQNGNYEGNLTQTRYDLSSDQTGCSAYTKNINQSTTGTALQIVASITKNDSEKQKIITYNYNNIPLFKIIQSGYNYFYFNRVEISQLLVNKAVYAIANLDTGSPINTIITTNSISMPILNFTLTETIYFFYSLTTQSTFNKQENLLIYQVPVIFQEILKIININKFRICQQNMMQLQTNSFKFILVIIKIKYSIQVYILMT